MDNNAKWAKYLEDIRNHLDIFVKTFVEGYKCRTHRRGPEFGATLREGNLISHLCTTCQAMHVPRMLPTSLAAVNAGLCGALV